MSEMKDPHTVLIGKPKGERLLKRYREARKMILRWI
jgi:hypothetical protein